MRPAPSRHAIERDEIVALGRARGLDAVGVAGARVLERARRSIKDRIALGLHDGMAFTFRNPDRSTDPAASVGGARSIVVGARSYLIGSDAVADATGGPLARVARYAWADHYGPLRDSLREVAEELRSKGWKAVVFADDNSIVDREVAWSAGIGWFGKNANLLLPGAGSWFVLGCVVTDADIEPNPAPVADGCGACRRCLDGCPTGAILEPGVIDAGRCLAWLVQRPGVFPREHRVALADRLYGCDDCQEVCPPNVRFARPRLPGESDTSPVAAVDVLELLAADDATLLERHGRWYLHDRQPRWLRRNALIVLGNVGAPGDERLVPALDRALRDPDPVLRSTAVWAAARLGLAELVRRTVGDDPDPTVRAELEALPGARGAA